MRAKSLKIRLEKIVIAVSLTCFFAIAGALIYKQQNPSAFGNNSDKIADRQFKTIFESDGYVRFMMEAYDSIEKNYWMKPGQYKKYGRYELPEIFKLSLEKAANITISTSTVLNDRTSTAKMLADAVLNSTSTDAKKVLAMETIKIVTYNLIPFGRSALYSEQQNIELRQNVSNINPSSDLYADLGIAKGASIDDISKAFNAKTTKLKNATSSEAKAELAKAKYANKVLIDQSSKNLYDTEKIEPTVFKHIYGKTLYIYMKKISPTTVQEFFNITQNASTTFGLDSMIIDLRGNIGGALEFENVFFGLFIGPNQYVFDLFNHEDYFPERTRTTEYGALARYKEIAVLVDHNTQSSAEVATAIFKRSKLAHVIGETTKGWGTVENVYPLNTPIDSTQKLSLFLVNNITLGDDNQPIEGKGVVPDVNVEDPNWKNQLGKYFNSQQFIEVIKARENSSPVEN